MRKYLLFCIGLLCLAARAQEPLDPQKAFRFSAQMLDANTVEARWQIEPGYYMYRDKFKFAVEPAAIAIVKIESPPGHIKEDETFGKVETYRDGVRILLRIDARDAQGTLTLKATSQGCADIGLCYPPQKQDIALQIPAAAKAAEGGISTPGQTPAGFDSRMLWPAIAAIGGLILLAIPTRNSRLAKAAGLILILGAAIWLYAWPGDAASDRAAANVPAFTRVQDSQHLDRLLREHKGRPVMLDFYADWCGPCKEMDRRTFADPEVAKKLGGFALLRADVTGNTEVDQALLKRFGLLGPPGIIFFGSDGAERISARVIGYRPPERFLPALETALK